MFEKIRTLLAVYRARDPRGLTAADTLFRAPGFHAVLAHRAAHFCALQGWRGLADGIAALSAQMTGVRIHADARVGENVYLAPGVWLGPDAVVPDGAEVFPEGPALLAAPGAESDEERLKKVEGALSEALLLIRAQEEKIGALEERCRKLESRQSAPPRETAKSARRKAGRRRSSPSRDAKYQGVPASVETAAKAAALTAEVDPEGASKD